MNNIYSPTFFSSPSFPSPVNLVEKHLYSPSENRAFLYRIKDTTSLRNSDPYSNNLNDRELTRSSLSSTSLNGSNTNMKSTNLYYK